MENWKTVGVVIEPGKERQPALLRASALAKKLEARLFLLAVVYDRTAELKQFLSQHQRDKVREREMARVEQELAEMAAALHREGLTAETKVLWSPHKAEAICKAVKYGQVDILVKATRQHSRWKQLVVTPTDWNLMRHSEVPVLLVKGKDWMGTGPLVVAVDVGSDDDIHHTLNRQLLAYAQHLGSLTGDDVHVVCAYPFPVMDVPAEFSVVNYEELSRDIQAGYRDKAKAEVADFGIPEDRIHLREGLAEEVIADVCRELQARLLLMGTVGRRGLSAAVIGNTAEHTVDLVDCDVLTLHPKVVVKNGDPQDSGATG
jgi:universal stress protein E